MGFETEDGDEVLDESGNPLRISVPNSDVTLDPDGTILGFMDDVELPEDRYQARITIDNQCGFNAAIIVTNSHGTFSVERHMRPDINHTFMTLGDVGNTLYFR